ncbi:hypothetical protein Bbelb_080560 [Branchiostoma belcheri]|nr:hypothetical protein Bbelb_080560 [Branchiostoma belcheri]
MVYIRGAAEAASARRKNKIPESLGLAGYAGSCPPLNRSPANKALRPPGPAAGYEESVFSGVNSCVLVAETDRRVFALCPALLTNQMMRGLWGFFRLHPVRHFRCELIQESQLLVIMPGAPGTCSTAKWLCYTVSDCAQQKSCAERRDCGQGSDGAVPSRKLMSLVEGVQRRATKFILGAHSNTLTYKERLSTLGLLPLAHRREVCDVMVFIKSKPIVHKPSRYLRSHMLTPISVRTSAFSSSYIPRLVTIWNQLSPVLRNIGVQASEMSNILTFKRSLVRATFMRFDTQFNINVPCSWSTSSLLLPAPHPVPHLAAHAVALVPSLWKTTKNQLKTFKETFLQFQNKHQKFVRERERDRERGRQRERETEKERETERGRGRQREREGDRETERGRQRERETERERERETERERERETERERGGDRERGRQRGRQIERD